MYKSNKTTFASAAGMVFSAIALFAIVGAFVSWIFMLLWNSVAVTMFELPEITFWKAWGLLLLINLVTSSFKSVTSNSK